MLHIAVQFSIDPLASPRIEWSESRVLFQLREVFRDSMSEELDLNFSRLINKYLPTFPRSNITVMTDLSKPPNWLKVSFIDR